MHAKCHFKIVGDIQILRWLRLCTFLAASQSETTFKWLKVTQWESGSWNLKAALCLPSFHFRKPRATPTLGKYLSVHPTHGPFNLVWPTLELLLETHESKPFVLAAGKGLGPFPATTSPLALSLHLPGSQIPGCSPWLWYLLLLTQVWQLITFPWKLFFVSPLLCSCLWFCALPQPWVKRALPCGLGPAEPAAGPEVGVALRWQGA